MYTNLGSGTYFHHLQLESPDPKRLSHFYGEKLDMQVKALGEESFICLGPARRLLVKGGTAQKLGFAAFACPDPASLNSLRKRIESAGLKIEAKQSPFFRGESFSVSDPDENLIAFGLPYAEEPRQGLKAPLQHLTLASKNPNALESFYAGVLDFAVSDRVLDDSGGLRTVFMRSNNDHHTIACFRAAQRGIDHHSYEAGDWETLKEWCDRFSGFEVPLRWGPGRHGPGNNLFAFIEDPDGNWIEMSAELEIIQDRPAQKWRHEERTLNLWGRAVMRS